MDIIIRKPFVTTLKIAQDVELDCGKNDMTITLTKSLLLGLNRERLRLIDVKVRGICN